MRWSSPGGRGVGAGRCVGLRLPIAPPPPRHNYGMALLQSRFERILAGWLDELGVPILREREVTGFTQDDGGVDVALSGGTSLRAQYLAGCDGGRSAVRKAAGIDFAGWDPTTRWIIAEVEMEEKPDFGLRGGGGIGPAEDGRVGVTLIVPDLDRTDEPTLQDVRDALIRVDGKDYGVHSPHWISSFTDMTRQAVAYRARRALLAGGAAHVHAPVGGQGLNIGAAGGRVSRRARVARRCRRTCARSSGRAGFEHRRAGRCQPGVEAGSGCQRNITGEPSRHVPR